MKPGLFEIGPPPDEPEDFEDFWRQSHEETAKTPLRAQSFEAPSPSRDHRFEKLYFDTLGGFRIGAWLAIPQPSKPDAVVVYTHGYGDLKDPVADYSNAIQCWVSAPGIALSARDDLPSDAARHVLHGIESRKTYLLRFCAAALWSAAAYLNGRFPGLSQRLFFHGISFSAGIGALALPWEPRYQKAVLELPTFGHHPLRFQSKSTGSASAVNDYRVDHPEAAEVLAYFDAASAASRIPIPVLVAPALRDPVVPPPGQFAVANALPEKEIAVFNSGHVKSVESDLEKAKFQARVRGWFEVAPFSEA